MSRPVTSRYTKRLENLLYGMMDDLIYFPSPSEDDEWELLVEGFAVRGADLPVSTGYPSSNTSNVTSMIFRLRDPGESI
ncbi:hypothetical protein PHMEG_00014353 [Phytophthora megakarya]|uniref:Uncharacterized protein n=1 Tax=Phytophthora megakarya TaxID=4795 RepID=A0A225W460_9STRA|nr:hypothetical protein PHMEG_00014353 [Phytophthora megakarya]